MSFSKYITCLDLLTDIFCSSILDDGQVAAFTLTMDFIMDLARERLEIVKSLS